MAHRALLRPVRLAPSSGLGRTCHIARPFSTVIDAPLSATSQQGPPAAPSKAGSVFSDAVKATGPRTSWTKEQIAEVYNTSLIELTYGAVCAPRPSSQCRL
jgi:biotin synthase